MYALFLQYVFVSNSYEMQYAVFIMLIVIPVYLKRTNAHSVTGTTQGLCPEVYLTCFSNEAHGEFCHRHTDSHYTH